MRNMAKIATTTLTLKMTISQFVGWKIVGLVKLWDIFFTNHSGAAVCGCGQP